MSIKTNLIKNANGTKEFTVDEVRTHLDTPGNPAGRRWDANSNYMTGDLATQPHTFAGGLVVDEYYVSQVDNNKGKDPLTNKLSWADAKIVRFYDYNVTITVGVGGDFTSLQEALDFSQKFYLVNGAKLKIKLINNFHLTEFIKVTGYSVSNSPEIISDGTEVIVDLSIFNFALATSIVQIRNSTQLDFVGINFKLIGATTNVVASNFSFIYSDSTKFISCNFDLQITSTNSGFSLAYLAKFTSCNIKSSFPIESVFHSSEEIMDTTVEAPINGSVYIINHSFITNKIPRISGLDTSKCTRNKTTAKGIFCIMQKVTVSKSKIAFNNVSTSIDFIVGDGGEILIHGGQWNRKCTLPLLSTQTTGDSTKVENVYTDGIIYAASV